MLCKHTNFYLHKKGDRAAVAFFKLVIRRPSSGRPPKSNTTYNSPSARKRKPSYDPHKRSRYEKP